MDKNLAELLAALAPIVAAVDVNDSDTLAGLISDDSVIWVATGSWAKPQPVTLGNLRRIATAAKKCGA